MTAGWAAWIPHWWERTERGTYNVQRTGVTYRALIRRYPWTENSVTHCSQGYCRLESHNLWAIPPEIFGLSITLAGASQAQFLREDKTNISPPSFNLGKSSGFTSILDFTNNEESESDRGDGELIFNVQGWDLIFKLCTQMIPWFEKFYSFRERQSIKEGTESEGEQASLILCGVAGGNGIRRCLF